MSNITTVTVTDLAALTDLYTAINANVIALVGLLVTIFGGAIGINIWKNTTNKKEIEHALSEMEDKLNESYSKGIMELKEEHNKSFKTVQHEHANTVESIRLDYKQKFLKLGEENRKNIDSLVSDFDQKVKEVSHQTTASSYLIKAEIHMESNDYSRAFHYLNHATFYAVLGKDFYTLLFILNHTKYVFSLAKESEIALDAQKLSEMVDDLGKAKEVFKDEFKKEKNKGDLESLESVIQKIKERIIKISEQEKPQE